MTQQIKGAIEKIGRENNYEEFCGKHILWSLFMEIYLEILIQKYLFTKTIGHVLFVKYPLQAL